MPPPGEPEALREHLGRVVQAHGEPVQNGAEGIERVLDRSPEQFFLAVKVVVKRAHPDVRRLGDLQDRDIRFPTGEEGLRGADERRASARLSSLQSAGGRFSLLRHACPARELGLVV